MEEEWHDVEVMEGGWGYSSYGSYGSYGGSAVGTFSSPRSFHGQRAGGGGVGGGGGIARRRLLSADGFDKLSLIFKISLDAYGKQLNNEEKYIFRCSCLSTLHMLYLCVSVCAGVCLSRSSEASSWDYSD